MKVAVYLKSKVHPSVGGNFSYHEKFIRAIDNHTFKEPLEVCFVGRFDPSAFGLRKIYYKLGPAFLFKLSTLFLRLGLKQFFKSAMSLNIDICGYIDRRILKKHNIDIVLFPAQFLKGINDFPFISMNWDAGHKTTFAFPELLQNFRARERWYHDDIQEALAIFVESEASKHEFCRYYAIPEIKIHVIPLFPGSVVDLSVSEAAQLQTLEAMNLRSQRFFYYPAQFWAHKNHYNLLLAFKQVLSHSKQAMDLQLVFSGSDMGNKGYIMRAIRNLRLESNVMVLGFISNQEVYALYKNALALVMPTFLGPTNMPLLEAQSLGTPVICSDLAGHREQCGHSALYADPAKPDEWAKAMIEILDPEKRLALVKSADTFRTSSPFTIQKALDELERSFIKISSIRKTFE